MDERERVDFRQLPAWQRAMDFALAVLELTDTWPDREQGGLTTEIRSDVVAVPAKIAAGSCAFDAVDAEAGIELASRLTLARRLLRDVEMRLDIAHDFGYLDAAALDKLRDEADEVRRLIDDLIEQLPSPPLAINPFDLPFSKN